MVFSRILFLLLIFIQSSFATAASELPKNLSVSDQNRALEILGFGSAPKLLQNPYPLGGYSGIEFGVASEFIPLDDLSHLGSKSRDSGELNYYTLTFGKGFYYNLDMLIYFTPSFQNEYVQGFGGQLKWGFFEAKFFPIAFSVVTYAGGANFSNLINVNTLGTDLIANISIDNMDVYFGAGRVRSQGIFIGGTNGITASNSTEYSMVSESHSLFGLCFSLSSYFAAIEINRYADSVYGTKIGYRF